MNIEALLADLTVVFFAGVAAVLGLGRIGMPPVVGFLVAGVLVGPHALAWIDDPHTIEVVAELGVALLLFTIGLEFSFDRLKRIGKLVAVGGTLQVGLTVGATALVATALGATRAEGVFWGYVAALSSTAIVLRALSDRGEVDAPHGRFVVGVLIFQDLCIVPMMLTVPLLAGGGEGWTDIWAVLGKAAAVVSLVVIAARYVVPRLLARAAQVRSREVFVLSVLLVASSVGWATSSLGLSIALGAFLAGIVVAETEFVHQVVAEVSPFRDALASLFFVSVGMLLDPTVLTTRPIEVGGLVLLLIVGKTVIATIAVMMMRFPARVAVLSGLALAQVGEFSFVVLGAGADVGLISKDTAAVFLAASVVTMMAAPVLLAASPRLAAGARLLRPLERLLAVRDADVAGPEDAAISDHVVVAGLGLGGRTLIRGLASAGVPYVGVDLNPETIIAERARGLHVRYGDVTSVEVLDHVAHLAGARQVVLLLSDVDAARRAARHIRARYPHVPVLLRVHRLDRETTSTALPGVQVVAEDAETAVEIVERVLRAIGVDGALMASLVTAARSERNAVGDPSVSPSAVATTFATQGVTLADGDWAVGRTLADVQLRAVTGALVAAIARDGRVDPSPSPHQALCKGDTLFVVGARAQIMSALRHLANGGEDGGSSSPATPESAAPASPAASNEAPAPSWSRPPSGFTYAFALAAPLTVTGMVALLHVTVGMHALALYALAIALTGLVGGRGAALLSAAASFLIANITFVPPVGQLSFDANTWPVVALCVVPVLVVSLLPPHFFARRERS